MNIKNITSADVADVLKMIPNIFKSKVQKSKEYVAEFLGLLIHRSNFYGIVDNFDNATPLARNKVEFDSPNDVKLLIEGTVILNKVPVNVGAGSLELSGYGLLEVDGTVVYDGRGGSGSTALVVQKSFIIDPTNEDTMTNAIPGGFSVQYLHAKVLEEGDPLGAGIPAVDYFTIRWETDEYRDTGGTEGTAYSDYFYIKPESTDIIRSYTANFDNIKEWSALGDIEDQSRSGIATLGRVNGEGFSPFVNASPQVDYTFPSGWKFQFTFTSIRMTVSDGTNAIDLT